MQKLILSLTFIVLVLTNQSVDKTVPQVGSIKGEVVDAKGAPIAGANVFDEPVDSVRIGKEHFVTSNEKGQFLLGHVPVGKTMVIATKVEEGYPDARFAVFSQNETLPIVEVKPGQVASGVVVRLMSKGGTLLGKVISSSSNLAVPDARVNLSRLDHPEWFIETDVGRDGTFKFILPSTPMHFSVISPGFKKWNYEESIFSRDRTPLTLLPESTQELLIHLEPIK
jgi:Carboxypeptidase regulatory-like domain